MKVTPEISVIVPVYNVEKYLNQCIASIIKQSFTDFELILVDDGSPDNCPQMCDEWAKKDNRIKVVHKINNGVAEARKTGVVNSNGKYIVFVDSDDWVESAFLKTLYDIISKNNCDIVQCNYKIVSNIKTNNIRFLPHIYNINEIKSILINDYINDFPQNFSPSLCNKIFQKNVIAQAVEIGKSNLSVGEDYLVVFSALCICNKVVVADTPEIYNYRYNVESVTKSYNPKSKYEVEIFFRHITDIANKFNIDIHDYSLRMISVNMLHIYKCAKSNIPIDEKITEIKDICNLTDISKWKQAVCEEKSILKRFLMRIYMPLIKCGYIKSAIIIIKFIEGFKSIIR